MVGGAGSGRESGSISLASLNVCCGLSSSLRPVKERAAEFCRRLEQADLDLVNFQEVWTPGLYRFLRRQLPSFPYVARRTGMLGQSAGGLVSFSRTPVREVTYTSFRGSRPQAGSAVFRSARMLVSVLKGVLTFEVCGGGAVVGNTVLGNTAVGNTVLAKTVVGNVHTSANRDGDWSAGNRLEALQAMQVRRIHQALGRARSSDTALMIVSGDFNLPSGSALYEALTAAGTGAGTWRDPFAAADLPTFHAELLPAGATPHRIDYLLVDADPDRYPVIGTDLLFTEPVAMPSGGAAFLSDHVAQVIRIAVPEV
jgi:hypothetical protein